MTHLQVFVKVNAPVDKGVAALVTALSSFEGVVTLESCQQDNAGDAYVSFRVGDDWHQLAEFTRGLSVEAGKRLDLCCGFAVRLEWYAGGEEPIAQVRVAPEHVGLLATALQAVAKDRL